MRWLSALALSLLLAACATPQPVAPPPAALFSDTDFAAPTERIDAADVFALSDAMMQFLRSELGNPLLGGSRQRALLDALRDRNSLHLEYDTARTRNAAEAFAARSGNCLSLVIMTAAFAKELGLQVRYQSAYLEETWSRSGNLLLRSGHVNISLGRRLIDAGTAQDQAALTIDFLPPEQLRGLRTRDISEEMIVAMYMNNRAAEALIAGRIDDAYWWSRAAIEQNPGFAGAYNTLGVIYLRRDASAPAARAFERALDLDPHNTRALANLAEAFDRQGRTAEAESLRIKLARIEPHPPFHFFHLGMAAMGKQDYRAARDLFAREVARAEGYHEFHFWLGVAHYRLGDIEQARRHLNLAMENSTTRSDQELYAAKLGWLQGRRAK